MTLAEMTPAPLRFASNIRFVTLPEWRSLHGGLLKNAYQAAQSTGWLADDADQFVLQPKTFTDSIGPCVAGGLTGNRKHNTSPTPMRAGLFHLIPRANLQPNAQQTIDERLTANKSNLVYPLGGLVCGGYDYDVSRMLASTLITYLSLLLKRKPSYFLQQRSGACTQLGYDGASDTWYIHVDSMEDSPLKTVDDLKLLYKKRHVSPDDTVFIGMTSQTPIPKEVIDSD